LTTSVAPFNTMPVGRDHAAPASPGRQRVEACSPISSLKAPTDELAGSRVVRLAKKVSRAGPDRRHDAAGVDAPIRERTNLPIVHALARQVRVTVVRVLAPG
jgi:hypothetical protein